MPVVTLPPPSWPPVWCARRTRNASNIAIPDVPGLLVECRSAANAVPTWYLRYKANGKTAYTRLGNVQELGLAQARKQAITLKAQHTLAPKQPVEATPPMGTMTLDTFMGDHYFPHATQHKRIGQARRPAPPPPHRRRSSATLPCRPSTAVTCRRSRIRLLKEGLCTGHGGSPRQAAAPRPESGGAVGDAGEEPAQGHRALLWSTTRSKTIWTPEQLDRLVEVLKTDTNRMVCLILMFLISTGARLNEALTATWKNVSVEGGVWKVDAMLSKSKKSRSIPLNDSALWVLEQLTSKGKSVYLFPSPVTGKPYTTITRAWYRLRKKAKIRPFACTTCAMASRPCWCQWGRSASTRSSRSWATAIRR